MSPTSIYLLLALCSATPLATGVRPFALFNGRATFTAPRSWGAIQAPASDTLEEVLFCIPNPISEGTPDAANVLVQIRPAPKVPNFRTYTDSLFAIVTAGEGHLVLTDTTDADHVRTIFWRTNGAPRRMRSPIFSGSRADSPSMFGPPSHSSSECQLTGCLGSPES